MISLEYIQDQGRENELRKLADSILEDLTSLMPYFKAFKTTAPGDENIMFDPAHDSHHYYQHVSSGALQIKDLLFVSDAYLRRLPEIYDIGLFKKLLDNSTREYFPFNPVEDTSYSKETIEKLLFLINVSEILSEHVKQNKTEYCQDIADSITQKNIKSMGSMTLNKETEERLFDQKHLSLILGNDTPYRYLLYRGYDDDNSKYFDNTAERLFEITQEGGHPDSLQIPQISDSNYQPQELNIPDFSQPSVPDENPLQVILDKFLPARRRLETKFWERYEGAQCLLPESSGRSI